MDHLAPVMQPVDHANRNKRESPTRDRTRPPFSTARSQFAPTRHPSTAVRIRPSVSRVTRGATIPIRAEYLHGSRVVPPPPTYSARIIMHTIKSAFGKDTPAKPWVRLAALHKKGSGVVGSRFPIDVTS